MLPFKTTPAGRAAIINAENTGTAPVLVTQIGVTAAVFDHNAPGLLAVPGEIKRLATFSGVAVADDTIHVGLRDATADTYTLRGFGLYLADGTLLGIYGQADPIIEKSPQAILMLAADIVFADISAVSISFGDAGFTNPPATTEALGVVELATPAEAIAGLDSQRAMTPAGTTAVLNDRLGAAAPTAFVKGLLALSTAALFRTALELGNAAQRNTGAGNGLDADLLDGQHGAHYLAWENLTGVPLTFPAAAHTQDASTINSGTFANARISVGNLTQHQAALSIAWGQLTSVPETATRWPAWGEVSGKPATFTPAPHNQDASTINSGTFANARIAVGSVTQHQASLSIAWSQLTAIPATASRWPVTAEVSGLEPTLAGKANLSGATFLGPLATNATNGIMAGNARFIGNSAGVVLAPAGSGNVILRPNGEASTVGQTQIAPSGNMTVAGSVTPTGGFDTGSSRSVKTDALPVPYGLAEVLALQPMRFRYRPEYRSDDRPVLGFMAEDVRALMPEPVRDTPDAPSPLALQSDQLLPVLWRAVQELAARVAALEAR